MINITRLLNFSVDFLDESDGGPCIPSVLKGHLSSVKIREMKRLEAYNSKLIVILRVHYEYMWYQ